MIIRPLSPIVLSVLGALTALATGELALRPFATAWREKSYAQPAEVRQYYEGISVAHYGAEAERLTGNPALPDAPNLLILGDSHVEALQVSDSETMGSVVERLARRDGTPVNVHQFGWSSAAAPLYAQLAPKFIARYQPQAVVVVLNTGDLYQAFWGPVRLAPAEDGEFVIVEEKSPPPSGWKQRMGAPVISQSVLAYHLYRAARMMQQAAATGDDFPAETSAPPNNTAASRASVKALKQAYGERLLIVYDMFLAGLRTETADAGEMERELMNACRDEGVRCVSTRAAFIADRNDQQRFSRGFSNTAPGQGHWNATGHKVLGRLIWQTLQSKAGR